MYCREREAVSVSVLGMDAGRRFPLKRFFLRLSLVLSPLLMPPPFIHEFCFAAADYDDHRSGVLQTGRRQMEREGEREGSAASGREGGWSSK